ncbi:LOW QUALITY PROTEIN: solute carrier family 12 member 9 [Silurus meridionalis]|uniref:LOW QUALITY PROTEIN: solute carrier family 12 member 9 n=1 Tax=Silurus meridionalis TaxID=175797 RepID=UPI001EEBE44C|nr:LOW QUALITY PROTEIN: solute carrier family 12 member 9 [Silurus meridionalis]
MGERTPLLHYRLAASVHEDSGEQRAREELSERMEGRRRSGHGHGQKLSTFSGVVIPTLLSMFSVVVFLRIGFVVGQCGLYQAVAMFLVAYFIISMTVLSICAISTNGALDAGGAYYMISRALGPEFGGSIGIMFFFANVCGSALYVLGLVEAILATFGRPGEGLGHAPEYAVMPVGYWWSLLYASVILLLCVLVCLIGARIYAKATFLIFMVVMVVLFTIFISFFAVRPRNIPLPNIMGNSSVSPTSANFTSFKLDTLLGNLKADYTVDYTTEMTMTFATVFAVMFNGCTGIMAGSTCDLRNPSYSIPRGTITAVIFTFITYNLLSLLVACTCDRVLLQRDYSFLRDINLWRPFVTIGVYSSTLSAAMSNLIGASRILYALARDDLFGKVLSPARKTSGNGNPWVSVLISWFLVQMVLFSGKLNTIASIVTIFFLLVYAAVDLACLALEWASAPNFRPTFRYFTWHTCVLGIIGCGVMMFLINAIYASASIAFMLLLLLLIHYLSPTSSWGYISQALIFHQVRKYLLMLDVRKDHVKFWRPQVLLMVANPRTNIGLITFINDIKKSGLYVLGHVQTGDLALLPSDPLQCQYDSWLSLVDHLNIKAFVNLTLADSVRHGVQHLLFISGLGGMRPNTLVLGFYDDIPPQDQLQDRSFHSSRSVDDPMLCEDPEDPVFHFPPLRGSIDGAWQGKAIGPQEYVSVIADAVKMLKNVALARYFCQFDHTRARYKTSSVFVDVWPINLLRPDSCSYVDTCSLFLLQLACILNMTRAWRKARLRLFLCVETGRSLKEAERKLGQLLKDLRMKADIYTVVWDAQVALHWQRQSASKQRKRDRGEAEEEAELEQVEEEEEEEEYANGYHCNSSRLTDDYLLAVNRLISEQPCPPPAVRFLYLPRPPADTRRYCDYLHQLELLSRDLGPTLLIHGVTPVITTDL